MKALEEKILKEGQILPGEILRVGSFLNQQIDSEFMFKIGEEIARLYKDENVTKILTIESSGIAIAMAAAFHMHVPVVFAKKGQSHNLTDNNYTSKVHSYTYDRDYAVLVSKEYIKGNERILMVDDFLAKGGALEGLIDLVNQSGATIVGAAVAIEKGYQGGGDALRKRGYRIESLAIIDEMGDNNIKFRPQ